MSRTTQRRGQCQLDPAERPPALDLTSDAVDEHLERALLVDHGEQPDGQEDVLVGQRPPVGCGPGGLLLIPADVGAPWW